MNGPGTVSQSARRLKALRVEAGFSMAEVARHLGFSHVSRYQHYEDRYKRTYLPIELIRALLPLFAERGIPADRLLSLAGAGSLSAERKLGQASFYSGLRPAGKDLPIVGAAMGGARGFFFNDGTPKDYAERPPSLIGVADAFAVYVYGDSMEPRYMQGEVVHVNPNRPITRNCFVVVELADGRGMIKQFLRQDDRRLVLRQFKPEQQLMLDRAEVTRICRIVGSAES